MRELREKIEETLKVEKRNLGIYNPNTHNSQGWVEALEYVLKQIEVL